MGLNRSSPAVYGLSAKKVLDIAPEWVLAEHGGPYVFDAEDYRRRVRAFFQHIFAAAIGAFDLPLLAEGKIDARMAQRAIAAVAGDRGGFDRNDLERFHFIQLCGNCVGSGPKWRPQWTRR